MTHEEAMQDDFQVPNNVKLDSSHPEQGEQGELYKWVNVKERPLFKDYPHMGGIVITDDGEKEFLAAVPYNDKSRPNEKNLWWIRHCVIEESGLCVVGDDSNEPAGWDLKDVTHWHPLPEYPCKLSSPHPEGQDELSEKDKRIKVLEGKLASVALMLKQSGNHYQFCEIKKLLK